MFSTQNLKSPCIWLGNEIGQKKMSSNEPKSMQNPLKHQHWPFQTTFQSTKVIWDPHGGFRPKEEEKIQNFDIFFRADPPCQHINGSKIWSSLFCISWGYDLATIKPKTTSLNLSRNSRSNSATGNNPESRPKKKKKIATIFQLFFWKGKNL